MTRSLAALALSCLLLTGCATSSSIETTQSREERVRSHFAGLGKDIAQKESLASTPVVAYLMVDEERLSDGTIRSLWATTASAFQSRCFYLDVEPPSGGAGGFGGCGGGPGGGVQQVTLGGNPQMLVGDVGTWPATQARITANGEEAVVPVKSQYFLVPGKLLKGADARFTVVLLDDAHNIVTEVKDLRPAGT